MITLKTLREITTILAEQQNSQSAPGDIHRQLRSLGDPGQHQTEGNPNATRQTYFRGGRNSHLQKIHNILIGQGYTKVSSGHGETIYHKPSNKGRDTDTATVSHDGNHVSSVSTLSLIGKH